MCPRLIFVFLAPMAELPYRKARHMGTTPSYFGHVGAGNLMHRVDRSSRMSYTFMQNGQEVL